MSIKVERATGSPTRPLVHVLFTGGTIAETFEPKSSGYVPTLKATELVEGLQQAYTVADLQVETLINRGSADITPSDWLVIARRTRTLLASPNVRSVVIIHGTDTLEETAFFLDLTMASEKPVVITGAMRPASHPLADGPCNILDALRVAVSTGSVGMGTLVVMAGQVFAARDVTKGHTQYQNSFTSVEFGSLGVVDKDKVHFYRRPFARQTRNLPDGLTLGRVEIVMHYAGADGLLIKSLLGLDDLAGLVVAGTGVGNVSGSMYDAILEVRKSGIPVVMSTRVHSGRVLPVHASKGRGVSLEKIGVVFADNLSPQKARVLLMLALIETTSPGRLQRIFLDGSDSDT